MRPLTLHGIETLMKQAGDGYEGEYQRLAMQHLCDNPLAVLQQSRQTGKTWIVSRFLGAGIVNGMEVAVTYPSLRQASRILLESTVKFVDKLRFPWLKRLSRGFGLEVKWSNGGRLTALSMDDAATAGVQGYTKHIIAADESHTVKEKNLAAVRPLVDRAIRDGIGHVILFGVGGPKESIIEIMKTRGYATLRLDDEAIVQSAPQLEATFAAARLEFAPEYYDQYYRCLPVSAGLRSIFPLLPLNCDCLGQTRYTFGIDVGSVHDETIVSTFLRGLSPVPGQTAAQLVDFYATRGDFLVQARQIRDYVAGFYPGGLRPHTGNVAVEINGLGIGLYHILLDTGFNDIMPVSMTDKRKLHAIRLLQGGAYGGYFAVPHAGAHKRLRGLTYEVDDLGNATWEHDDLLSSCVVNALLG